VVTTTVERTGHHIDKDQPQIVIPVRQYIQQKQP